MKNILLALIVFFLFSAIAYPQMGDLKSMSDDPTKPACNNTPAWNFCAATWNALLPMLETGTAGIYTQQLRLYNNASAPAACAAGYYGVYFVLGTLYKCVNGVQTAIASGEGGSGVLEESTTAGALGTGAVSDGDGTVSMQNIATQAELDAHAGNTSNPHSVTASQIGNIDPDLLTGDTVDNDSIDQVIIDPTVTRDSELSAHTDATGVHGWTVTAQTMTAATQQIDCTSSGSVAVLVRLQGDAAYTLTSNPQIDIIGMADGQLCLIEGASDTNTITIVDGSGLQLRSTENRTLGDGDFIMFMYSSANTEMREVASSTTALDTDGSNSLSWRFDKDGYDLRATAETGNVLRFENSSNVATTLEIGGLAIDGALRLDIPGDSDTPGAISFREFGAAPYEYMQVFSCAGVVYRDYYSDGTNPESDCDSATKVPLNSNPAPCSFQSFGAPDATWEAEDCFHASARTAVSITCECYGTCTTPPTIKVGVGEDLGDDTLGTAITDAGGISCATTATTDSTLANTALSANGTVSIIISNTPSADVTSWSFYMHTTIP